MKRNFKFLFLVIMMATFICSSLGVTVFAADEGVVGTANLNNTVENSAKVGDVLKSPEKGWKRYDDFNENITYSSGFGQGDRYSESYTYKGTYHQIKSGAGDKIKFNFVGSKLNLISTYYSGYPEKTSITIDGQKYYFSVREGNGAVITQSVIFTKRDLNFGEHTVIIEQESEAAANLGLGLDAIDIDESGELKEHNPDAVKPTTPEVPTQPETPTGNKALLKITLVSGLEKEYDMTMTEVNAFIDWYDNKSTPSYTVDKKYNIGPFGSRKDYIAREKIECFEVMEYTSK